MKITKLPNGGTLYELSNGVKCWYLNDVLHREGGSAIEWPDGDKYWYLNGEYHREDGPAVENIDGYKAWYLNGKPIHCTTQKQFLQLMKLKAFW
jgi:hypothetical protein